MIRTKACLGGALALMLSGETRAVEPGPRVIQPVATIYPNLAVMARILGYILIDVDIDKTGKVKETHLIRGIPLLDAVSLKAAQKWRFEPAPDMPLRTVRLTFAFDLICEPASPDAVKTTYAPPYRVDVRAISTGPCDQLADSRTRAFKDLKQPQ